MVREAEPMTWGRNSHVRDVGKIPSTGGVERISKEIPMSAMPVGSVADVEEVRETEANHQRVMVGEWVNRGRVIPTGAHLRCAPPPQRHQRKQAI